MSPKLLDRFPCSLVSVAGRGIDRRLRGTGSIDAAVTYLPGTAAPLNGGRGGWWLCCCIAHWPDALKNDREPCLVPLLHSTGNSCRDWCNLSCAYVVPFFRHCWLVALRTLALWLARVLTRSTLQKKTQTGNNVLISHAYLPLDSTGRGASRILIPEVKRFGARDIKVGLLARTTDATLRALSP
jgi:hypothetical protein